MQQCFTRVRLIPRYDICYSVITEFYLLIYLQTTKVQLQQGELMSTAGKLSGIVTTTED